LIVRAVSVVMSQNVPPQEFDRLMLHLTAQREDGGWYLEREGHRVHVVLTDDDIPFVFTPSELDTMTKMFRGRRPTCRASIFFSEDKDQFTYRMAVAISHAIADSWPAIFDDHIGGMYLVNDPGQRAISS
jgi:hypothetical protein